MIRPLNILFFSISTAVSMMASMPAEAAKYGYAPGESLIVGKAVKTTVNMGETFADLAIKYELGFDAIVAANPGSNPWFPSNHSLINLPTQHILPDVDHEGIVVNLPEMRLYYFDTDNKLVYTYPVGIGRAGWETPLADTTVTAVKHNPTWTPPQSIIKEYKDAGLNLPSVIPAGPNNPLGDRAIRLGLPGYLLHGTNQPSGVGMRVSHGCIRLYPEHIRELAELVGPGTRVQIINQPIKWAKSNLGLQLEAHRPLPGARYVKSAGNSHLAEQTPQLNSWIAHKRKKQSLFSGTPQTVPDFSSESGH